MPFQPEPAAPQVIINPNLTVPDDLSYALPLLSQYRRVFDHMNTYAKRPGLLPRGMAADPVAKCLEILDETEQTLVRLLALMQTPDESTPQWKELFHRRMMAARTLFDSPIRKHADQLGIVIITEEEDGFRSNFEAIRPHGLLDSPSALYILFQARADRTGLLFVEFFGSPEGLAAKWSVPVIEGGLTPFCIDFRMGSLDESAALVASRAGASLRLPIHCTAVPPATLRCRIVDSQTLRPMAARVSIFDVYRQFHAPVGARVTTIPSQWPGDWNSFYRFPGQPFFYSEGFSEIILPPGEINIRALCGFEYEIFETCLDLQPGEVRELEIPLLRWIDMPEAGWHPGQTHIHSQHLMPVNDFSDWHTIPAAEGLSVSFLTTFQQFEEIFSDEYPIGPIDHLSRPNYYLVVNEEFRHVPFGHMTFSNLKEIIEPISTGVLGGKGWPDAPCNAQAIDLAHEQGAVVIYCHADAGGPGSLVQNDELPIDAALGKVDLIEIMGAGGGFKYWYPMLNCGLRIGAAAGPDWRIEDCNRVYVYTGKQDFTFDEWMQALKEQKTFVTTGPMLLFEANGELPGTVLRGEGAGTLRIQARAVSHAPIERLEIIRNGRVVSAQAAEKPGQTELSITAQLSVDSNSWIAARCHGEGNAHTSPIYIEIDDRPMGTPDDARPLLEISERCLAWTEKHGRFRSDAEREEVLALFRQGVEFYRRIVESDR